MLSVEIGTIKCPCHKLEPKHSPECKEYEELSTSQNTTDRAQYSAKSIDDQMRTLSFLVSKKIKNPTHSMHSLSNFKEKIMQEIFILK